MGELSRYMQLIENDRQMNESLFKSYGHDPFNLGHHDNYHSKHYDNVFGTNKPDKYVPPQKKPQEDTQHYSVRFKQLYQSLAQAGIINQKQADDLANDAISKVAASVSVGHQQTVGDQRQAGQSFGHQQFVNRPYGDDHVSQWTAHEPAGHGYGGQVTGHEPVGKPHWYDHMTNAEKKWFDELPDDKKSEFISKHDMEVGGVKQGHANINQDHEDFQKVSDIAQGMQQRSGWQDHGKTFNAAAGLWNRHRIRQQMGYKNHDDLLQKDHHLAMGKVLKEWHFLAGIKE